jgi:hypothetical protein
MRVARFSPTIGWSTPEIIETDGGVFPAVVALDRNGRGFASWTRMGTGDVRVARLSTGGWEPAINLELDEFGTSSLVCLELATDGTALGGWVTSGIFASRDAR